MISYKASWLTSRYLVFHSILATSAYLSAQEQGNFLEDLGVPSDSAEIDLEDTEESSLTFSGTFSVDGDLLISDDIRVDRYSADFSLDIADTTIDLGYSRSQYDIDFATTGENLREFSNTVSLGISQKWSESFSSSLSLSGYTGFTSFRPIWISETTAFEFGGFPQFQEFDPFGFSVGIGNTYSLPNEVDSITLNLGYSRDRISPGQGFGNTGFEVGDDTLDTVSASLTGNFYITNLITTQWSARVAFVSEREVRTQLRVNAAWNPINPLTFRAEFGATIEQPEFQAFFGGLSVNYQILDQLTFSAGYRVYGDTGEINSSDFNSSAPDLDTRETSASLLWSNGIHSLSASVAFLETDFANIAAASQDRFGVLFSDRNFFAIRAAYTYQF